MTVKRLGMNVENNVSTYRVKGMRELMTYQKKWNCRKLVVNVKMK